MIDEQLNKLKTKDINSLILFALFQLKNDPKYSTLSELAYILDGDSFTKMLQYFGGMTIKIPTLQDFKLIANCLLLYEYVNLERLDFNRAIKLLDINDYKLAEVKDTYYNLCDILAAYDFGSSHD